MCSSRAPGCNFNPRSPCGERLIRCASPSRSFLGFQSTLPVWGATLLLGGVFLCSMRFQSTLPVWGATDSLLLCWAGSRFQSTLPVWGATCLVGLHFRKLFVNFNPRSPCGERLLGVRRMAD